MDIEYVLPWLEGSRGEVCVGSVAYVVNAFCSSQVHKSIRRCTHILHFGLLDSLLKYATCSQLDWPGQRCLSATNLEVHRGGHDLYRLLHFRSRGSEWCTDCFGKYSMREKITSERIYQNWYCSIAKYIYKYITKSLQTSEETTRPNRVYQLTTDKLQPV